jgi:hypothetical protein
MSRNTLIPVFLLPPELLARVFHFYALADPPWHGVSKLGWIKVTHVCRHWRQVALDHASLWARISGFPMCIKWITEQLSRAKNAPLEIELLGNPTPETISLFPPHLPHTRELRLRGLSRSHFSAIKELCSGEAPDLEHLELFISVSKVTNPLTSQDFDGAMLFRGKAPKLRTLSLSHIRIPWSFFPRCQFTQLKIVLSEEEWNESPSLGSLDQLIDVLANCPNLEVLTLECCLPSILSQSIRMRNVHLPRLSYLSLAGSIPRVVRFFEFLNLPSSTKLNLHGVIEDTFGKEGSLLIPLVFSHFNRPTLVTFRSFKVVLNHLDRSLEINASTATRASTITPSRVFDNGPDDNPTELSLSFISHSEFRQLENIVERACSVLPIAELEFLSVAAPDLSHPLNWEELFRKCEKLTTIEASGHGTTSLLQAITPSKAPPTPPNNSKGKKKRRGKKDVPSQPADTPPVSPPIFPQLKSLHLKGFDFSELVPQTGNVYDVLVTAIQRRKNRKKPLKTLCIDRSILCQRQATALEKLVREFHWSGEEAMSFDEYDFDDFDHYSSDYYDHGFHDHGYHDPDVPRLEDYFNGTTQAEWEWFENYSDGY